VQTVSIANQVAPSNAAVAAVVVMWYNNSGSTNTMDGYVDDVMLVNDATLPAYFDGDQPSCGWAGVSGQSVSNSPGVGAEYLITMSLAKTQEQTATSILSQLANMGYQVGIDYGCDYYYRGSEPQVQITISYPRRGIALNSQSVKLDVSQAIDFEYDEDGTQQANSLVSMVSGTGGTSASNAYNNYTPSTGNYPALEKIVANPAVSGGSLSYSVLSALVNGALSLSAYPTVLPVVTMPLFGPLGYNEYNVGDDATLYVPTSIGGGAFPGSNPRFPQGLTQALRIIRADYTIPDEGIPSVALSLNVPPGALEILTPAAVNQVIYATNGAYSWPCPLGVTSVAISAVGAGGGGGNGGSYSGFGGGGGGAGGESAAETVVAVTPNTVYTVTVGAGGAVATAGGLSSFVGDVLTVTAHGGGGGASGQGGVGGTGGTGSTNTTHYNGGAGGHGGSSTGYYFGVSGGGGGGSGGTSAAGNAGAFGGAPGVAVFGGGPGGAGANSGGSSPITGPGGGGGGAFGAGAVGFDGQVMIQFLET
jgi:hypothetical protein